MLTHSPKHQNAALEKPSITQINKPLTCSTNYSKSTQAREFPQKKYELIHQALNHPYLNAIREKDEEIAFEGKLDFSFEMNENFKVNDLKKLILQEINLIRKAKSEEEMDVESELAKPPNKELK